MPAAAVIPAPIAYIKIVAVKTLVVEYLSKNTGPPKWCVLGVPSSPLPGRAFPLRCGCARSGTFTLRK